MNPGWLLVAASALIFTTTITVCYLNDRKRNQQANTVEGGDVQL